MLRAAAALTQVLGEKIEEEEVINEKTFETELEEPVPAEQTHSEAKQKEDKSDEKPQGRLLFKGNIEIGEFYLETNG